MKFSPEGHKYEGFTQYFFEGKELFWRLYYQVKISNTAVVKVNT
jgi:hypothetical protein